MFPPLGKAEECRPQSRQRQIFLPVICSSRKKPYLLRYKLDDRGGYVCAAAHSLDHLLEGQDLGAGKISSSLLGAPLPCPYCGNEAFVLCECGMISCIPIGTEEMTCPTCGMSYTLSTSVFDIDRSHG